MKKFLYLSFCLAVLAGFVACAITDYGIITDDNQVQGGSKAGDPGEVVDTASRSHIKEEIQIATIVPGGTDELFSFIDQKADGTATLTTFNNFSTGSEPIFHSDTYCNTRKQGCSIFTAPDVNDSNIFDGTFNGSCSGASSLSFVLAIFGRSSKGECGNTEIALQDRLNLLNSGIIKTKVGQQGLLYYINRGLFSVTLDNQAGVVTNLPMIGDASLWVSQESNWGYLDARNPLIGSYMRTYAGWLADWGTDATTATLCYSGVCAPFAIAGNEYPVDASSTMNRVNRRF